MSEKTHTSRLASYKSASSGTTELRRKRAELSVALRKQARDEQLLKRRALSPEAGEVVEPEKCYSPEEIVLGLKAADLSTKTTAARAARRMLSKEQNPPINVMVNAGVIKPLVDALDRHDCSDLQFEAAWALTNIASGTHNNTQAVIDGGAIPKLVMLLSQGGVVGEQSAWALGNIAGDGPEPRDTVLRHAALPALLPHLTPSAAPAHLRTAVWTFSNLCRNKNPLVEFDQVAPALPLVSELLESTDKDVLADACWALSYLTDGPNERIEAVQCTPKLLPRLIALLDHKSPAVKTPALRTVGNMLTGSDEQTDRCLNENCLAPLTRLLRDTPALTKEAAWAISNILAGTTQQIQRAIDCGLLEELTMVLAHPDFKCQKEAAWAITNLCLGGSAEQLQRLLMGNTLPQYCALMGGRDPRALVLVLDGINHLLQAAAKYGQVEGMCLQLEEIGALDLIEALQQHENEEVYKKTMNILDTYFAEEEQETNKEQEFNFQAPETANIQF